MSLANEYVFKPGALTFMPETVHRSYAQALELEIINHPWELPEAWDKHDAIEWAEWVISTGDHGVGVVEACQRFIDKCGQALVSR